MYRWIVGLWVRRNFEQVNRSFQSGDFTPIMSGFAEDVRFEFPGEHALAGTFHGRSEVQSWFERVQREFGALEFEVHDVVVAGWPWKTRVCTVFTDRSTLRDGTEYVNHGVLYDEGAWGKVKRHRVFFDTQVAADAIGRVVGTAAG